jgi:hypothetical protein
MITTPTLPLDSLSDPNPPTPGPGERAAVSVRAGTIARRRRLTQGFGALACTAVIGLGVVALVSSNDSSGGSTKIETASAPDVGTKATDPTPAPTVAAAVTPPADDRAHAATTEPAAEDAPAEAVAPAVALASANVSISGAPDRVTLHVTLTGANGTFSSSVRTPGSVGFSDVPPGDYQVQWSWESDDGTATAVGRGNVTLAGGPNSIPL